MILYPVGEGAALERDKKFPTSPATVNPSRPYVDPIEWIHRGNDGWIPFTRMVDGQWQELYSAPAMRLPSLFDGIADDLDRDSYFGINSMIHPGAKKNPRHPSLPQALHKADKVKYLNAAWVDLDFYKLEMELHEVIAMVIFSQQRGLIPPASLFADSGRGLWLIWLLHDPNTGHGPRAWPDKKLLWAKIMGELYRRLTTIGADRQSKDLSRLTRVPGSLHTKVSKRVAYWVQADQSGRPFVYTLSELKESLKLTSDAPTPLEVEVAGITPLEAEVAELGRPSVPRTLNPLGGSLVHPWDGQEKSRWGDRSGGRYSARGRKGYTARWLHALNDFKTLRSIRGAFSKGCRNHAALVYAFILWRHRYPFEDIVLEVGRLGRECVPPLAEREIDNAIKQAQRYHKMHNAEIADLLLITPDESSLLEKWPPMGTPRPDKKPMVRIEAQAWRREAIKRILDTLPAVPTLRQLQAMLLEVGLDATLDTLRRDLAALGVSNPRRRKKAGDQDSLFQP